MMLSLDSFVFSLQSAPFKEVQRQRNGMVAADNGIGKRASLDDLAKLADAGDAYVLVDGTGSVYGAYVIESLNETATYHTAEGIARKIEFNLTLKRVPDDSIAETIGDGKSTADSAKSSLSDLKAVAGVASTVVDRVRNLSINSVKSAVIDVAATMAPGAADAAIKGLSTANGMGLDKAITTARQVSELNGEAISSVVNAVLDKVNG
jgi:phage protein U